MDCPFCKEEIIDGSIKCKHCKSMLAESSIAPEVSAVASYVEGSANFAQQETNSEEDTTPQKPMIRSVISLAVGVLLLVLYGSTIVQGSYITEKQYTRYLVLACIGCISAIISLVKKHRGKKLAIGGLILNVLMLIELLSMEWEY